VKRVLLAPKARAFLVSEAAYLRDNSPRAAERFLDRMREARRSLGRFEQLGFAHDALPLPGIRRLVVGDYLLDYFPGDPVMIVAIRHSRQRETAIVSDAIADFEQPPVSAQSDD
jgi:plasmid stabilization system protein ParE